jgi:hypothetical protein
MDTAFLNLA